jgi:lipopolysaccharide heptosyltransferase II
MPNVKLLIIGDAPGSRPKYRQELEALVKRLNLSKYISFLGERHDIVKQYEKLDLLVMPSIGEETFGRVIIEAQAKGVPVIASRIGGIVDIIKDNENGILVAPRDHNSLSEAVIKVLKDKDLQERFSKNGRESVEKNFSLELMYKRTIRAYGEAVDSLKILIIKWSALGDIILSLPAIKAVRGYFPKAKIILLTSPSGREFFMRYPYVDDFMIYHNRKGIGGMKEMLGVTAELRREAPDLVLDLQNNKLSHIASFLSGARRRIGYKTNKLDFLLNEAIEGARLEIAPIEHQFRLLKALGIEKPPLQDALIIGQAEQEFADDIFSEGWIGKGEKVVAVNCWASQRWLSKRWPVEKAAVLCDLLAQKRIRVIITGSREDKKGAERLFSLIKSKPLNIVAKTTVMELAAVIKKCDAFITSDSAPMHLAAFLNVPFVALFGPTDPKRHLEPSGKFRIINKKLKCSPCYKSKCSKRPNCMEMISPEEVLSAVIELLQ